MIKMEQLKAIDYIEGLIKAAHLVLIEVAQILKDYEEKWMVVGGWVPDLLFPNKGHIGSIDVDILINHITYENGKYEPIVDILLNQGYEKSKKNFFLM